MKLNLKEYKMYLFLDSIENPPITGYQINYLIPFTLMKPELINYAKINMASLYHEA